MGSIASGDVTMLPVHLHGIELGRAVGLSAGERRIAPGADVRIVTRAASGASAA
jgi:hypothetical protein